MIRFSGVTTIRGADSKATYERAMQKRAEVASFPQVLAFRTTIPRTEEHLYVFLTDEDAVTFKTQRNAQMPLLGTLVDSMSGRGNPNLEAMETGLTRMVDEGVLQQYLQQHPDKDINGEPHERIDCNRYWFKPGTPLGMIVEGVRQLFNSQPVFTPRGKFDFDRDLKNPILPFAISDEEL